MDEPKLRNEADRGNRAKLLLADPLISSALSAVKDRAWDMFVAGKTADDLSKARDYLTASELFIRDLGDHIVTGNLAQTTLAQLRAAADKLAERTKKKFAA